jgi:probable rRNA maturation factor
MIEVISRQRTIQLNGPHWEAFTAKAMKIASAGDADVTIVFVSDRFMRKINRTWRGKHGTTDVLSFPANQDEFERAAGLNLGDVFISVEQAERQANENGLSLDEEIAQLILHGLLHLCGYDHETDNGQMNRLEVRLRRRLGI